VEEDGALELGVAADFVIGLWVKVLAVLVVSDLLGVVLTLQVDKAGLQLCFSRGT
jgi:hypothetical protein